MIHFAKDFDLLGANYLEYAILAKRKAKADEEASKVRDRFEAWERAVASADRCVRAVLRPLRCVDPPWWWWWLR